MGFARHFFSGNRQEVNSTWYPEIEEPIKSREKHYSLVVYILNRNIQMSDFIETVLLIECLRKNAIVCDPYLSFNIIQDQRCKFSTNQEQRLLWFGQWGSSYRKLTNHEAAREG